MSQVHNLSRTVLFGYFFYLSHISAVASFKVLVLYDSALRITPLLDSACFLAYYWIVLRVLCFLDFWIGSNKQ